MRFGLMSFCAAILLAACTTYPAYPTDSSSGSRNPPSPIASSGEFRADRDLLVCRGLSPSNAPPIDARGRITTYSPYVNYNNRVILALKPVRGGCFSSGFGRRGRSSHKGIDISASRGTPIFSGAKGVIAEAQWRNGFGNQIVIDHGWGLYTRYAHMTDFGPGVAVGAPVDSGAIIGYVGATGNATGAHLHYEVLTGNIRNSLGSIGLQAIDPFSLPPYVAPVG
ncbi:MAG: M23 family metallopeptidase [Pseudomonadota bacterium]